MSELWMVNFHAEMSDIEKDVPVLDGKLLVNGTDIFEVLEKARDKIKEFGFDRMVINGVDHDFN